MIQTNGRRERIDHGARTGTDDSISAMRPMVGYSDTGGRWTGDDHAHMFKRNAPRSPATIPTHTFTCEACNTTVTRMVTARFCSDTCRNRAAKRRQMARERATR